MEPESMLQIHNNSKSYRVVSSQLEVLKGVDLEIAAGGMVAVMGPSGSGKSTLLDVMGVLDSYDGGEYRLDGHQIKNLSEIKAAFYRNRVLAFVFQSFNLIPFKNTRVEVSAAEDNLAVIREGARKKAAYKTNTLVKATASGMVLEVPVEEGDSVIEAYTFNEGTTIATIGDRDEMIFEGKVDESEVGGLSEGMELLLTVGALETEEFHATLEYISPKGRRVGRCHPVRDSRRPRAQREPVRARQPQRQRRYRVGPSRRGPCDPGELVAVRRRGTLCRDRDR